MDEAFTRDFGDLFYTADKGARSLRDMASHRFNHVIATALSQVGCAPEVLRAHWARLGLIAQLPDRPFVKPDDPKPKVEFVVEVGAQGSVAPHIVAAKDYTQFAALPKRLSEAQARATAYHEAGHAVVNDPAVTGQKLTWLTILGDVGNLGFALYDEDEDRPVHVVDRRRAVLRLARLMAGQTAMTMAGFAPDAGWAADLRAARQLARRMILEWGLDPEFLGVAPAHDTGRNDDPHMLSQRQIDRLSDTIVRLLAEALKEAEGELGRNWDLVEALVSSLMECGYVSGDTFDQLREQCPSREAADHPKIVGVDVCARLLVPTGSLDDPCPRPPRRPRCEESEQVRRARIARPLERDVPTRTVELPRLPHGDARRALGSSRRRRRNPARHHRHALSQRTRPEGRLRRAARPSFRWRRLFDGDALRRWPHLGPVALRGDQGADARTVVRTDALSRIRHALPRPRAGLQEPSEHQCVRHGGRTFRAVGRRARRC